MNLSLSKKVLQGTVDLVRSKSITNRLLIMQALAGQGGAIHEVSKAKDSQTLQHILNQLKDTNEVQVLDVGPAGTCFRFLTAFLAQGVGKYILTGSERMKQRPIGPLVDALHKLGASIKYLESEGFPPLAITGKKLEANHPISIDASISSQFITALLLIAPYLDSGLTLKLTGRISSKPYLTMTLALMQQQGVQCIMEGNQIQIVPQPYNFKEVSVESDWSAAAYFYGLCALVPGSDILLKGLQLESVQGDSKIQQYFKDLGVQSIPEDAGVRIQSKVVENPNAWAIDFTDIPDTAQTFAVVCAALNIDLDMRGLDSLRIKETDRILALQKELSKIGVHLIEREESVFELQTQDFKILPKTTFETYEDHRMAMSFAQLAVCAHISIEHPTVVEKSFPHFWEQLEHLGFSF